MEKFRFYVDLPGDFWESGALLRYLREREVQVSARCLDGYGSEGGRGRELRCVCGGGDNNGA
jgi:hypothetical protein